MNPDNFPDRQYTYVYHSPGIEPWICGLLKDRVVENVLDVGCGVGSWGFLIKNYISPDANIIGVDLSAEKLERLKKFKIYNELIPADITTLKLDSKFDVILAIEVLHNLSNDVAVFLSYVEMHLAKKGLIVVSGPSNPHLMRALRKRNYEVYDYQLRGLVLTNTATGKTKVMWRESKFLRIFGMLLRFVRFFGAKDPKYVLAFKESV